jgi:cell division protein FtsW
MMPKTADVDDESVKAKNYQVMQAKAAIVHGGVTGMGPGKSALKQMLPQSASDFIFAIIVEEYGILGAGFLITMYMIMIIRIVIIASKMPAFFGSLQLAVNIAVAVNLIPVTGQPLPLISYGGTSMLVTYIQLGLVLSVSSRIQVYDEEGIGKKQSVAEINDIA